MFKQMITLTLLLLSSPLWASFEVEITPQQMQQVLAQQFPISQQTLLAKITLSDPQLSLPEQQLALATNISADFANQTRSQGMARIEGKLGYSAERGEFLLLKPALVELDIEGLNPQGDQLLKELASQLVVQQVESIVLYRLNEKRLRERLTKQNLKSVTIRDGSLFAEMDW